MNTQTFFINNLTNTKYDQNPIILLDSSGSISSIFNTSQKSIFKSYEDILIKILRPEQYECYICQWSRTFSANGFINIKNYKTLKQHEGDDTNLDCAFNIRS